MSPLLCDYEMNIFEDGYGSNVDDIVLASVDIVFLVSLSQLWFYS